jgi:hypothetical protein
MPAAVILWWGSDIRVLGGSGYSVRSLEDRDDPVAAILAMAGDGAVSGRSVRIIYHPATLEAREVACPNVGRKRLHKLLSADHAALTAPDTLWSAEALRRGIDGFGTVVYIDAKSRLPLLVEELARRGIRTEGAWSLQSLVEATPPCDGAEGVFLGVVATGRRALVSCVNSSGDRLVRFQEGPDFADAALAEVGTALALLDTGEPFPALCALEEGPATAALRERLAGGRPVEISLPDFLARARTLTPGSLSDILPRRARLSRGVLLQGLAAGLGVLLMAGSGWSVRTTRQAERRLRDQAAAAGERHLQLQAEIARRLAAREEIAGLRRELGGIQCPSQNHYALLMALARSTPSEVSLRDIEIEGSRFSIRGRCSESAPGPDSPLSSFRRSLAQAGLPWELVGASGEASHVSEADFTLEGQFR